ncbi:NYN domain-containing protein [bacterium]|nr:NYN domain-containing protein [bacterium]
MDRVAVFIDEGYLNKALDNLGRPKLDYGRFIQAIKGDLPLLRAYYYYCMPYQSQVPTDSERAMFQGKQSFIRFLSRLPRLELRQGRLAKRGTEFVQKRVDIMLAVDLVRLASLGQIQEAYLVAGDSDLVPAINHVKDAGVSVGLYFEPGSVHDELLDACDELHPLSWEFVSDCLRD